MNWDQIALASATVLLPYLNKAGEAVAQKIGKDMYNWLKEQFTKKEDEQAVIDLKALEENPNSDARLKVVSEMIENYSKDDPKSFGSELVKRLNEIKDQPGEPGMVIKGIVGDVNINIVHARDLGILNQGNKS